jgi:methionyl-tRNA formyltransferase
MRILCCLNRDLASNLALNLLLPTLRGHDVLVGVTERVGQAAGVASEPAPRVQLRITEQLLPNELLFPLIERAGRPDDGARLLTFAEIERHRGYRVVPLPNPNGGAGLDTVRGFAPDLILTIRYGAILKAPVIAIPRLGVLNLHSGLLPAYRGVLATFRALLHGDSALGCTLHYIVDGTIDTGDVVGTRSIQVDRERSLLWHILALYPPGMELMSEAVQLLAAGAQPARRPQPAGGEYFSYPSLDDWTRFLGRGWRISDPSDLLETFTRYLS